MNRQRFCWTGKNKAYDANVLYVVSVHVLIDPGPSCLGLEVT